MEQETILYYYPLPVWPDSADNMRAAKKHWFQEAVLQTAPLMEREEFNVLGCAVPPFYYRKKVWKGPVLAGMMEAVLQTAAGMTDSCVHPDILRILAPEMRERWHPHSGTVRRLTKQLLEQQAGKALARTGMVTVLLGQPAETRQQLQTIWELLEPYLPRVNRMLLYYEEGENGGEELQEYAEDYYYEYGLVPQFMPYRKGGVTERTALRCGKERCGGVILDYGDDFRYPKTASADCVYIDVASDAGKEQLLGRKSPAIPYLSPLKYLDTLVKNSYDRKVKMT